MNHSLRVRRTERVRMVRRHLAARGIRDRRVLAAMAWVPRERFVEPSQSVEAYADRPLPIGDCQTISQPYMVALTIEAARPGRRDRVLEVGTGTGYQTAVLARLAGHVWSIERITRLAELAEQRLHGLGIRNVTIIVGDGAAGYPPAAPFDAIVVAAAAPEPPRPLLDQLADRGRLVIPVGSLDLQDLMVIERAGDRFEERHAGACRFVPLISPQAFETPD